MIALHAVQVHSRSSLSPSASSGIQRPETPANDAASSSPQFADMLSKSMKVDGATANGAKPATLPDAKSSEVTDALPPDKNAVSLSSVLSIALAPAPASYSDVTERDTESGAPEALKKAPAKKPSAASDNAGPPATANLLLAAAGLAPNTESVTPAVATRPTAESGSLRADGTNPVQATEVPLPQLDSAAAAELPTPPPVSKHDESSTVSGQSSEIAAVPELQASQAAAGEHAAPRATDSFPANASSTLARRDFDVSPADASSAAKANHDSVSGAKQVLSIGPPPITGATGLSASPAVPAMAIQTHENHESAAVSPANMSNTHALLDASVSTDSARGQVWHIAPSRIEAGVESSSHTWISVTAERQGGGIVAAFDTTTVTDHRGLEALLPSLSGHLAERQLPVHQLAIAPRQFSGMAGDAQAGPGTRQSTQEQSSQQQSGRERSTKEVTTVRIPVIASTAEMETAGFTGNADRRVSFRA